MRNIVDSREAVKDLQKQLANKFVDYDSLLTAEHNNIYMMMSALVDAPIDPTIDEEEPKPMPNAICYWYKIADLFDEVYKRTSFIGKTRALDKEGKQNALDVYALTSDEEELFTPFLNTIVSKVFDSLSAFTRNIDGAILMEEETSLTEFDADEAPYKKGDYILIGTEVYECIVDESSTSYVEEEWQLSKAQYLYTNDKLEFVVAKPYWFNNNAMKSVDNNIQEAIVNYIIAKYFKLVYPAESDTFMADAIQHLEDITIQANKANKVMNRDYTWF